MALLLGSRVAFLVSPPQRNYLKSNVVCGGWTKSGMVFSDGQLHILTWAIDSYKHARCAWIRRKGRTWAPQVTVTGYLDTYHQSTPLNGESSPQPLQAILRTVHQNISVYGLLHRYRFYSPCNNAIFVLHPVLGRHNSPNSVS